MAFKPNKPITSNRSYPNNSSNIATPSSNNSLMNKVEFFYGPDEFLKKAEEFGKELAGNDGDDLGKSQLRKFYDQVISLRDEMLQKYLGSENPNSDEIRDEIIFKLKLLQSRVIYLTMRKSGNRKLITENSKKYLLGILERGINLCKRKDIKLNESMKQFVMEFEAIYAFFYTLAQKD